MSWNTKGFNFIKEFFEKAMEGGHLSHAYIFSGQEMLGKKTFALELANCINNIVESVIQPDIFEVDPNSSESGESITIAQIRNAKNFLSLSAYAGPYKFVIINDADKMTVESQNAFLKILEEASPSSIIILVTAYPEVLLPTIYSRCQEIIFPNHSQDEIKKALLIESVPEEKAEFLSDFTNGRLGLALRIVREDQYTRVKDYLSEFAKIKKAPLVERLKIAHQLSDKDSSVNIKEKLLYWMLYLKMNLLKSKENPNTLKNLIQLNYLIGEPQFNRRLMLENFMVKL